MKKLWILLFTSLVSITLSGCLARSSRNLVDNSFYREMLGDEAIDEVLNEYDEQMALIEKELDAHQEEYVEELVTEAKKEGAVKDNDISETVLRAVLNAGINAIFKDSPDSVDYSNWAYQPGNYFTDDYTPCNVHKRSDIKCKNYYYDGPERIDLGASQCFGFARYAQYEMYGKTSYKNSACFSHTKAVSPGALTVDTLISLVEEAGVGAHIRTGNTDYTSKGPNNHSMIITEITENGFSIIQCNGHNNYEYGKKAKGSWEACRVGTYTYTWEEYVNDDYGRRGIDYIEYYDS